MKKQFDEECRDIKSDKTSDYMKYLHEQPTDVDKWLEFIESQSKVGPGENLSVYYERTLAIYARALVENPASFRLKIELVKFKATSLELDSEYNASDRIEKDFFDLLFAESAFLSVKLTKSLAAQTSLLANLFETWREYLKFLRGANLASLAFNKIKRAYVKCFEFFLRSDNDVITKHALKPHFIDNLLRLVEDYSAFLCANGYVERAFGVYQVILVACLIIAFLRRSHLRLR